MANFKAVIHQKQTKVKIQVTHQGKTRYINTGIAINPETEFKNGQVINHARAREYNIKIRQLINAYDEKVLQLGAIRLKNMSMETLLQILRNIDGSAGETDFFTYAKKHADELRQAGKTSYSDSIKQTIKVMQTAMQIEYIDFKDITPFMLQKFTRRLEFLGYSNTTAAIYLRNIRTLYNLAIKDPNQAVTYNDYPFRSITIPKAATRKINLTVADLQKLTNYSPKRYFDSMAVDLFLLSFYLIGINFKDLLLLRRSDMQHGRIIYDRAKTGKPYSILVPPEALVIIQRLAGEKYLLNVIEHKLRANEKTDRTTPLYKDITDQANKQLKRVAVALDLPTGLSTYWARHTWATIARNIGIPKDDIVTALGHGDNRVTDAYIEIDLSRIDKANRAVIDTVKAEKLLNE